MQSDKGRKRAGRIGRETETDKQICK